MDSMELMTTSRRGALKVIAGTAAGFALAPITTACAESGSMAGGVAFDFLKAAPGASLNYPFELPDLPYAHNAFTEVIDEMTMEIHHVKHHAGYTKKLNAALQDASAMNSRSIVDILSNLSGVPQSIQTAVQNSGGGYLNHALFWPLLSPDGGGEPTGELATAISRDFGSFAQFKDGFSKAAGSVFGSGWAWLAADADGKLSILQTANQDTPLALGKKPVLGIDVWEHAYYLKYQNRRADYIQNFWSIINWEQAAINYSA